jgi:hypothetical protein
LENCSANEVKDGSFFVSSTALIFGQFVRSSLESIAHLSKRKSFARVIVPASKHKSAEDRVGIAR